MGIPQGQTTFFVPKETKSANKCVQATASLLPSIGTAVTIATSTIDGIYRLAGAISVTASQLVVLMANGGAFVKTWSLEKHPKYGEIIVKMVFYNVTVGTENRMFGIYSSKHALIIRG